MRRYSLLVALLVVPVLLAAQRPAAVPVPDVTNTLFPGTFSILGFDPDTGEIGAAVQSRVMQSKVWLTQGDGRVRDSHAAIHGERVDIGAAFSNGLRFPHDPLGPASETVNCRCSLTYSDLDAGTAA